MIWNPNIPEWYKNQVVVGDARELSKGLPDDSIDMIFTDPCYSLIEDYRWLAEAAMRVLKPGGDLLAYSGGYYLGPAMAALIEFLDFRWLLIEKKLTSGSKIWTYRLFNHYVPLIWCTKGKPRKAPNRIDFMWSQSEGSRVNHKWAKGAYRCAEWLNRFGLPDDVIWDPYCGGGAIIAACKRLDRDYVAFEIDPDVAESARDRVKTTYV